MIGDTFLRFADSERPPCVAAGIGLSSEVDYLYTPFPGGYDFLEGAGASRILDLLTNRDFGRGTPLIARFQIMEDFGGSSGLSKGRFAIAASDNLALQSGTQVIARGWNMTQAEMKAGVSQELLIPSYGSMQRLLNLGFRYMSLGMEFSMVTSDFNAGSVTAKITLSGEADTYNTASGEAYRKVHGSGFTVKN